MKKSHNRTTNIAQETSQWMILFGVKYRILDRAMIRDS
jgi:hypothetical protein